MTKTSVTDAKKNNKIRLKRKVQRAHRIRLTLGIILAIVVWGLCIYAIIVIAANSSMEEAKTWSKNFSLTIVQELFVMPFVKIFLTIFLLKRMGKVKNRFLFKIMRNLIVSVVARSLVISMNKLNASKNKQNASDKKRNRIELPSSEGAQKDASHDQSLNPLNGYFSPTSPLTASNAIFSHNGLGDFEVRFPYPNLVAKAMSPEEIAQVEDERLARECQEERESQEQRVRSRPRRMEEIQNPEPPQKEKRHASKEKRLASKEKKSKFFRVQQKEVKGSRSKVRKFEI